MKLKILIIILLILLAAGAGIWFYLGRPSITEMITPTVTPPASEQKSASSAIGWSTLKNEGEAAQEAVAAVMASLNKNPDFAFVYCASAYDEEKILAAISLLLPNTKIIGGNSGYGVLTPGGYFLDPDVTQAVGVMAVADPQITWGVAAVPVETVTAASSKEAAKQAVIAAIKDSGKTGTPSLIIDVSSFEMDHEKALEGIIEVGGAKTPVFGAYAVDKGAAGNWKVFANKQSFHTGVAIAVVYTDLKIGFYREHGFEVTEKGGTVTKANGNTLIEIDGRPAAVVYNELIGGLLATEVGDPAKASLSKIRITSAVNPLAKVLRQPGKEPFYVPALPVKFLADKSILMDVTFEVGDELKILRSDWEILLNRLRSTPEKAMNSAAIDKSDVMFALNSHCCATHYVVPATERLKAPQMLREAIGTAPFMGILSCGIENFEPSEGGNVYTSMGNGTLIFSKK